MKATAEYIEKEPEFKPIKVEFELESKEELANFYAMVGLVPPRHIFENISWSYMLGIKPLVTESLVDDMQYYMFQAIKPFVEENFKEEN